MLTCTPWQKQMFDIPVGLSSCYTEVFGAWLYMGGITTVTSASYLSKVSDDGRTLGSWEPWGADKGSAVAGSGCWNLPSGLYGVKSDRTFWHISTPGQTVARTLGGSALPVTIASTTVTKGGVPVQPAFFSLTGMHNTFMSIPGVEAGGPRIVIQPEAKDGLIDQQAPTSTTGRQTLIFDDLLLGIGGVSQGGLLPLLEIRATHVTDYGRVSGNWKTVGSLPDVFEAQGLNRQKVCRWRDWLLMVGGSVVAASTSSSSVGVWAARFNSVGDGSLGPWVQLADLPVTVRSCGLQVIGDYLHVLGGVSDGVTTAGPYLSSVYTTRLQEVQG